MANSSLFYERAGSGPSLVLLHANYLDRRMWDPQFPALAQRYRVLRYDARGLGRSGPARSPFSPVEDLYRVLQALGIRRTALIGCSLGAATALDFALAHPDMVNRLVLVGPGISGYDWPPVDFAEPWRVTARAALARGDTVGVATAWLHSDYLQPASEQPALAATIARLLADNVEFWKGLIQDQRDWDTAPAHPALGRLGEIHIPVLLIVGSRDIADIQHVVDSLEAKLPHVRKVVLDGAGHLPNLEQPEVFLATVRRFLEGQ